ncbi:DUF6644 family protein [Roseomonas xinghualingensis]|uniref:DUF6644 family protein n=1 Tax=Roseomonas xinghualingensis TaxID=2986475 RepID=UPI0021F0B126|nr:DUF6644 family protein [Roseomonas sp. SXEYE001]MCV4209429.1 DUF2214 domain-containing protein [Roseomonas sp. SXEYE001]
MDPLQLLAEWPVAAALRRSELLYPTVNAAHILSIGMLVGAIFTLDLRVIGAFGRAPLAVLGPPLVQMAAVGVGLALVTGFLLFSVRPSAYATNPAFLIKLGLIAAGLLNVLLLRLGEGWRRALAGGPVTALVRMAAIASMLIWVSAVLAGRWIAFLD